MTQDMGASPDGDRATHEQSPRAVSAVPVGIPSASDELRALAADETKSGEEIRDGIASILSGIDPRTLAELGIV